jgi:hypothetical protein
MISNKILFKNLFIKPLLFIYGRLTLTMTNGNERITEEKCKKKPATNSASCTIVQTRLFAQSDDVELLKLKELNNLNKSNKTEKNTHLSDRHG